MFDISFCRRLNVCWDNKILKCRLHYLGFYGFTSKNVNELIFDNSNFSSGGNILGYCVGGAGAARPSTQTECPPRLGSTGEDSQQFNIIT